MYHFNLEFLEYNGWVGVLKCRVVLLLTRLFITSSFLFCATQEPSWKRFLAHVGPGFMVSLAYLDPGNCESLSLSLSLLSSPFSLSSLSRFSQPFSKLKQWKRICKLEQITDMRYIFSAFQKQRRFCSFLFRFCAFLFATISLANLLNFYSRRLQKGNLTECLPFAIA